MPNRRMLQVNELIHAEVDRFLVRSYEAPHGVLPTIEEVKTAADLSSAKIFVSVLPISHADEVLKQLNALAYDIRSALMQRLDLKTVPKLIFVADDREERADRINRLLDMQPSE